MYSENNLLGVKTWLQSKSFCLKHPVHTIKIDVKLTIQLECENNIFIYFSSGEPTPVQLSMFYC